jgi:hypothetical protein
VLTVTCEHPGVAFTIHIRVCRIWRAFSAHKAGPYQYATNASLRLDGRYWLAPCASLPPSLNFSRSNARGKERPAQPQRRTSQTHDSPGILQGRCGMNAASSPIRQSGVSSLTAADRSGLRQQIAGCVRNYASTLKIHATMRVFRGPGDRQPAAGRRERTALVSGYGSVGPSSWSVWSAIAGRLTPRPWERRMLRRG